MATYTFDSNELDILKTIAERFAENADTDTSSALDKVKAGKEEVELSELERIGLQSILQVASAMAEVSDEMTLDAGKLEGIAEKLTA